MSEKLKIKPFVKWLGGKNKLWNQIYELFPPFMDCYIEPFLGGGSCLFNLQPKKARVNDLNYKLIQCYLDIKNDPKLLMDKIDTLIPKFSETFYKECRDKFNTNPTSDLFIFLNKTNRRGLYRESLKGNYNAAYGHYKTCPIIYDRENILNISKYLNDNNIIFHTMGYDKFIQNQYKSHNDFIFADPPYYGSSIDYTGSVFTNEDHSKLVNILNSKNFVTTNSDSFFIRQLYDDNIYNIRTITTSHSFTEKVLAKKVNELIICPHKWFE